MERQSREGSVSRWMLHRCHTHLFDGQLYKLCPTMPATHLDPLSCLLPKWNLYRPRIDPLSTLRWRPHRPHIIRVSGTPKLDPMIDPIPTPGSRLPRRTLHPAAAQRPPNRPPIDTPSTPCRPFDPAPLATSIDKFPPPVEPLPPNHSTNPSYHRPTSTHYRPDRV